VRTSQTLSELRSQRKTVEAELSVLDEAISALERYQKLSQPNSGPRSPAKAPEKAPEPNSSKARRQIPKTCPICGIEAANGAGLSAHLRSRHSDAPYGTVSVETTPLPQGVPSQ
jgi:hypothetical protein